MAEGSAPHDAALERAFTLLETMPLVDGHNDLPWVIGRHPQARGDVGVYDLARPHPDTDTDIPRLRDGRVSAQFWAAFIPTRTPQPGRATLEQIDIILRLEEAYPDVFLPARQSGDVAAAKQAGKIASFITVEGGVGLEGSLAPLRVWHAAGVRLMTLCHNETLDWIDSTTDAKRHGGLTEFGRAVVRELNRLGMIVDCAHVSHDAMRHVLDVSAAPIVMSHSNAYALCDHPRNVPDDVLERVRHNGGMVMATFVPDFINQATRNWSRQPAPDAAAQTTPARTGTKPPATLEQLADHLDYLVERMGIDHVGIGSDFFGGPTPLGLENVGRFPYLIAELLRRDWPDEDVAKVAGGNLVRVLADVERISRRLRAEGRPQVGRIEDYDATA